MLSLIFSIWSLKFKSNHQGWGGAQTVAATGNPALREQLNINRTEFFVCIHNTLRSTYELLRADNLRTKPNQG